MPLKAIDSGKDKVKKICDALKKETLRPAKEEASRLIDSAKSESEGIVADAKAQAEKLISAAKDKINEERNVFEASLNLAAKQSLSALRESIEKTLLHKELGSLLQKHTSDPHLLANLLNAIVKGIEKEGLGADLMAVLPNGAKVEEVTKHLLDEVKKQIGETGITLDDIGGGVKVMVKDENFTIDVSEEALKQLMTSYVQEDFRKTFFSL